MKNWFKENKTTIIGISIGAFAGLLYWRFWGCANGRCILKSNPYYMTVYGGVLGGLIINLFKKQST